MKITVALLISGLLLFQLLLFGCVKTTEKMVACPDGSYVADSYDSCPSPTPVATAIAPSTTNIPDDIPPLPPG